MALPPETADAFVREVDENLRRDQTEEFLKRNLRWIVGGAILFLAAVGGYFWYENHQKSVAREESEQIAAARERIGDGNIDAAEKAYIPLSESSVDTTRANALFTRAALAAKKNDNKNAVALYKQIEDDSGLPQAYRDTALLRRTLIEYDAIKPDEVISRMAGLAKPGEPFFGSAGELTGMAMLAKGDKAGAGQMFARLAADKTVPESIRIRAAQLAGSLGVDASASVAELGTSASQ
nr:tetratricopeptide repeat protein [uncultured Sphingomonas sp.]